MNKAEKYYASYYFVTTRRSKNNPLFEQNKKIKQYDFEELIEYAADFAEQEKKQEAIEFGGFLNQNADVEKISNSDKWEYYQERPDGGNDVILLSTKEIYDQKFKEK